MLLWHPNLALLQRAVASVIAQAGRWRLIISWSGILAHDIYHYLSYLGRTDSRVILLRTGSRSAAVLFGSALFYAQETHTCLIGQHDRLSTDANRSLCLAVETADIVIADEDELKDDGERSAPHMGTVWDPEASACIDRRGLIVFSTSLLRKVGGMRDSRTGFGEWDMLLRASAKINEHRIKHVPRIMCYRSCRVYGAGTPASRLAALGAYLAASPAYVGAVAHWLNGAPRIQHALPAEPPMVSIIIPTRDRPEYLETCVRSMLSLTSYEKFEILILDNDSQENRTSELLHEFEMTHHIRVIKCSGAFNWSLLNNSGVAHMHGEIAVFLNNDTEVHDPGWLTEIVVQANRREVGAVGIRLLYPNGNIQHAGIVLGPHGRSTHVWRHTQGDDPGYLEQLRSVRRVSAVTGACLATRRSVFDSVGGFECQHLRVTWSDVDYCLRVREQGLHVLWTPHATLIHHEQATRGPDNTAQAAQRLSAEQDYMRSRWGDVLDTDPFWSPNMWPGDKDPLLSFLPPRATQ
jgi:GT2 family glycosyltransferase